MKDVDRRVKYVERRVKYVEKRVKYKKVDCAQVRASTHGSRGNVWFRPASNPADSVVRDSYGDAFVVEA